VKKFNHNWKAVSTIIIIMVCFGVFAEPQKVTVVMLGDSTILCSRNKPEYKLTNLVQANLKNLKGMDVSVINSGKGGNTVKGGLSRLQKDVFKHNPDVVTISFGLNDTGKLTPAQFKENLEKMIETIQKNSKAKILLITSTPFDNQRHAWRKKFAEKGGLDEYMDTNICVKMRELVKKYNLQICDLHENFKTEFKKDPKLIKKYILPDGVHLANAGNEAAAKYLAPNISSLLLTNKKHKK